MERQTKSGWEGALWGVAGLLVGGAVVFLILNARGTRAPVALAPIEPHLASPAQGSPATPPKSSPDPVEPTEPGASAPAPDAATPPNQVAPVSVPPPGPQIGGSLPSGAPFLGGNTPMKVDLPEAAVRSPEVQLARLNVYTSDAANARDEVLAFAAAKGARIRTFTDYGTAEHDPSEGLLVMVPDKDADDFVRFVLSKNANVAEQRYRITPPARQARIQDEAQSALFALKAKRQKLLVKYLEDADPVKEVEASIAVAEAAIKRLRIEEAEQPLAAIKITFGPRG